MRRIGEKHGAATRPAARSGVSVRDVATMLDIVAGPATGDPYWAPPPTRPFEEAVRVIRRICGSPQSRPRNLAKSIPKSRQRSTRPARRCAGSGHRVEPIELDPGAMLVECTRILICVGIAAIPITNPEWIDPVVREMYEFGRKVSGADYVNLVATMHNIARTIVERLEPYDALLTACDDPARDEKRQLSRRVPERYLDELWTWIAFEYPFNATGQPAITIPAGFSRAGLPIGPSNCWTTQRRVRSARTCCYFRSHSAMARSASAAFGRLNSYFQGD